MKSVRHCSEYFFDITRNMAKFTDERDAALDSKDLRRPRQPVLIQKQRSKVNPCGD
jgi:hypothetical protein